MPGSLKIPQVYDIAAKQTCSKSKADNLAEDVVILELAEGAPKGGKAKAHCDRNAVSDLRNIPDLDDSFEPAGQQVIRDTLDMMSSVFQQVKRQEDEVAKQHKVADELGAVAQQLRAMATLQVGQMRRLEEMLRYYRNVEV